MATTNLSTDRIRNWRSIVCLVVFVLTNLNVLFPFRIPIPVPRRLARTFVSTLVTLRIIPPRRQKQDQLHSHEQTSSGPGSALIWLSFPMNFVTGPLIADLFLLAILAIGRQEVHDGTVGADNIDPINIMVFFITLAYIAISIDSTGLIRWLAYKVLQSGGKNGKRLYLYLYTFFFALASFIGNDPVILSGTPFLAYMTRISKNIEDPKAWIYTQFAMANIASAILVSSNPTNLVLAGAFQIKFIVYTANIIVPVIVTVVLLFPFLLYFLFQSDALIPKAIQLHELPESAKGKQPLNPNIPNAEIEKQSSDEEEETALLEEILNPYLERRSAAFGACIMTATLVTILAVNAATPVQNSHPVWWVTLPAAGVMLCWDLTWGWLRRNETRKVARESRERAEGSHETLSAVEMKNQSPSSSEQSKIEADVAALDVEQTSSEHFSPLESADEGKGGREPASSPRERPPERATLESITQNSWSWCRETFPTATTVLSTLPLPLVPFSLCMFVLVQSLVTHGWVAVFAYGWNHWIHATGTVGAVGGMAFMSIILCNFAGTNIGTSILLCRVVQAWLAIHSNSGTAISQRTFWATIYSMTLGLNYGAFSLAFSASLAGLLWREILARKHVFVRSRDFMRINFGIIAFATVVGCAVLVGEMYIIRPDTAYTPTA
ncbi:hypothetical protein LTR62_008272 [Meristemomyces frigidus]|uniref:Citrate transporter-like domain-containing protein n=1 Tax=Meristemomyces frigidus TaxID=1508187 RepID=A0AAN7TDM3_9PEZI|nr:hypothetical protein LTR62_008272 [Meristemomyces frigidus]